MAIRHPGAVAHATRPKKKPPIDWTYWHLGGLSIPIGVDVSALDSASKGMSSFDPAKALGTVAGDAAAAGGKAAASGLTDFFSAAGDSFVKYIHQNIWVVLGFVVLALLLIASVKGVVTDGI